MKKQFLSFLFVAVSSSALFAQVSFGPKVGLGISSEKETKTPSGSTTDKNTSIITPTVGVVLNAQLGDIFALRPELLYLQRGTKTDLGGGVTETARVSYLELPINVAAGLQAGPGRFEVYAGPAIGVAIGGAYKAKGNSNTVTGSIKPKKEPSGATGNDVYINPINVSLNFGLDYKFDNGLLIQVGYNLGLSNLQPHYSDSNLEDHRKDQVNKASAVNISVAYLFGGKK
ncbi:MAG: hypothetical protein JWO58_1225 [Chitinophagaceae bacterium]|nr:hypothetical protein [Chitinophagaceae bacterium]